MLNIPEPYLIILELDKETTDTIEEINTNKNLPTIDIDAMMSSVIDFITLSDGSISKQSRSMLYQILLESYKPVGEKENIEGLDKLESLVEIILQHIFLLLYNHGVFKNGIPEYEFGSFLSKNNIILRKAKVLNNRIRTNR